MLGNASVPRWQTAVWLVLGTGLGALAVQHPQYTLAGLVAICVVAGVVLLPYGFLAEALIASLALQNIVLPLLLREGVLGPTLEFHVIEGLEAVALLLAVRRFGRFLRGERMTSVDTVAMAYLALLALYMLVPGQPILARVASLRTLVAPVIFFAIGSRMDGTRLTTLYYIGVVSAIVGLAAYPVDLQFWRFVGVGTYWEAVKHIPLVFIQGGLPASFTETYASHIIYRLSTTYGDPLASGYALVPIAVIATVRWLRGSNWWVIPALTWTALFLTVTKAGIGMAAVGAIMWSLSPSASRVKLWKRVAILASFALVVLFAFSSVIAPVLHGTDASLVTHGQEFLSNWSKIVHGSIMGSGLGSSGLAATVAGGTGIGTGDSDLFDLMFQVGLPGMVMFSAMIWVWTARLRQSGSVMAFIVPVMAISGFISAESFTFTTMAYFWALVGYLTHSKACQGDPGASEAAL